MQNRIPRPAGVLMAIGFALAIALTAAGPVSAASEAGEELAAIPSCQPISSVEQVPDIVRVQLSEDSMMEKLQGEAALTHLYNLFSRRPQAFKAAREALSTRGFRPTDHVYVERTVRLAANRPHGDDPSVVRVQNYSEQDSDGEIIFWSWDDGNNNTWEGAIYMEIYSTGAASTWQGQIDASDEDHEWVYYQKTWSGPGGGGGPIEARFEAPPLPTRHSPTITFTAGTSGAPYAGYSLVQNWISWAKCWRACSVGGCAGAAVGCILSGPLWPGCWGATCTGVLVGCGITCGLM